MRISDGSSDVCSSDLPADMVPLIGPGFKPTDEDEKGLWQLVDRAEEEISGSNLLIKDPELVSYLQGIIGRVGGPAAKDLRIYLAQDRNSVGEGKSAAVGVESGGSSII